MNPKVLQELDIKPLLLVPVLALAVLPFIESGSTWLTLTVAGLAMGMIIFIIASGLTLVFGLMDVLNFGHGAFVSVGAFTATLVLLPMKGWVEADSILLNLSVVGLAIVLAMLVTGQSPATEVTLPAVVLQTGHQSAQKSTSTGTSPISFRARNSGLRASPLKKSTKTGSHSMSARVSASATL